MINVKIYISEMAGSIIAEVSEELLNLDKGAFGKVDIESIELSPIMAASGFGSTALVTIIVTIGTNLAGGFFQKAGQDAWDNLSGALVRQYEDASKSDARTYGVDDLRAIADAVEDHGEGSPQHERVLASCGSPMTPILLMLYCKDACGDKRAVHYSIPPGLDDKEVRFALSEITTSSPPSDNSGNCLTSSFYRFYDNKAKMWMDIKDLAKKNKA